ncbi:IS1 family transposase [Seonamhaeicola maritimus]|uniref:IS1 family transposase n=1 Tax=Seonamhaeicola maritimus TaxID=2591822 RepID=A0A5C7GDL5_9FLAO|nr:IS1 family transposase [Seonamhaeicola maritimus]TXG34847.1 IS1 family transposase [Seonamhaeicola maritimus]
MNCKKCQIPCIKNGFQNSGKQRYYCKLCKTSQQESYTYKAYNKHIEKRIYLLVTNSCGINDISRILKISRHTVKSKLLLMSERIKKPIFNEFAQKYEIDEIFAKVTALPNNCWVTYAINRETKQVIDVNIGKRGAKDLDKLVNRILLLKPKRVYTDKWKSYKTLIPNHLHRMGKTLTNNIERYHLNLRTHIKCLSRKTICYCKSVKTLTAIVSLYFWGYTLNFKTLPKVR